MRKIILAVSFAAVPVLTVADHAIARRPSTARHAVTRPSQERLDQIRRSLVAQIAVRDVGEGLREPTAAEAAVLSNSAPDISQTISLPNGGVALVSSGAQLSLVMATKGDDGTMRVRHGEMPSTTSGVAAKGGSHVR